MDWASGPFRQWSALSRRTGTRYRIRRRRRDDGTGWAFILRINGSAETSPAVAHPTLAAAVARAEALDNSAADVGE